MEHDVIETLRERHPAWRLLRATNAPLVLAFLGRFFVEDNHGATSAPELATALDDELFTINAADPEHPVYPRGAGDYLDDWSTTEAGWLRRFYPLGSDEVHYDATPAFEKAYAWVTGLQVRSFVGTESRLNTVVELLRQMVLGSETDPQVRLAELRRRRDSLDEEIAAIEAGHVVVLDRVAVRDRYQQFASTARELLSDFRQVEENFRALDRAARERIAAWEGSKGDLLAELVGTRADISASDQGRSFQSFYDFLLSEARQDELADLLARVETIAQLDADRRLRTVHHDWSEAAERTQQTVRQISEQLRRFLDDRVWLENRRVLELVRAVDEDLDVDSLFEQTFVDHARLAENVRTAIPPHASALLADIVELYPIEQGAAEIVGYLALTDDDIEVSMDETETTHIEYTDGDRMRRARLPQVTVTRR